MLGDYFLIGDQDEFLKNFLKIPFEKERFSMILDKVEIHKYIYNLSKEDFLQILF